MTELPNGWEIKRLSDCLERLKSGKKAERGWSPQCLSHPSTHENVWGVLKTTSVQMGEFQPEYNKELPEFLEPKSGLEVNTGDFLVTTTGPRNRCGIVCHVKKTRKRLIFSGKILRFRVDESLILPNWLMYLLMSPEYQSTLDKMKVGTSDSSVSIGNQQILDLEIPVPPIKEQKKIVELLEDHISRINAALADVYCAKSKSSQLKLAILSKVFKGEFFEFELPVLCINDVAKVMNGDRGKNYPNKSSRVESGVAFINAGHLDNDLLNIEEMDFISEERFNLLAAGKIELNDLLFCLRGSLGKVAINDKFTNGAIASSLAILRVGPKVLPKYLYYYFLSPLAAAEIRKHDNGTAQPNLSAANLRRFEVPIPTIEQQKIVIDFLDSELSRTIQASHTFTSLFFIASAMRRSLLQAAFTGQLTKEVVSV